MIFHLGAGRTPAAAQITRLRQNRMWSRDFRKPEVAFGLYDCWRPLGAASTVFAIISFLKFPHHDRSVARSIGNNNQDACASFACTLSFLPSTSSEASFFPFSTTSTFSSATPLTCAPALGCFVPLSLTFFFFLSGSAGG
jgi:hypothetical protein